MEKKAQVWVETVIYTLIGLAIIGILLAVIRPQINSMRDKLVIEQTIDSLNKFDGIMSISEGNRRKIDFKISKGSLFIDGKNDNVYWILEDSKNKYSEPGSVISLGVINLLTTEDNGRWDVNLSIDYSDLNITYYKEDKLRKLEAAGTAYSIFAENKRRDDDERTWIDIEVS